ncbi:MAG: 2Fe-2S iron-sulfur cluster-binding protein [Lysobacterales bacterium]
MIAKLQSLLRAGFMRAEALFNRAFGDRLNPYYHLGSICFFLFWIVAGSGLYLYAFFDTSVVGAYQSVEALTQHQWYAGGVLRSVHRYASDAMVLLMLLHALRHFAFDRLRGFRSFSWLTGIALIWLVYVSGINGYMLPWDRLAQFVIVGSFEWIDGLPGFGGTLIRNFIYPESVNDRLFSLLSFIHIGVPLLVLLLMWVHVQRVPKAQTQPPRPIALGVSAMLLLLALLQPVFSQGGTADLATEVQTVALDWLILPIYPLFDAWPASAVWALVISLTGLLTALPWLAARRSSAAGQLRMQLHPGTHEVLLRPGETVLEAGLRAGLSLPYECRNGGCGLCLCTVLNGRIDPGPFQPAALSAEQRAQGQALMCCAMPLEDVEIEIPVSSLDPDGTGAMRVYTARVQRMEKLGPAVMRVWLALPVGQSLDFGPGQYLNIILEDGARRAFSFANAPHDNALIELHFRLIPGGRYTTHVFEQMRIGDEVRLEGPCGTVFAHPQPSPPGNLSDATTTGAGRTLLLIAGATGFAPIKSILEDAFHRGIGRRMVLYWGVRAPSDCYLLDLAEAWQRQHPNFSVVPVLSEPELAPAWPGRTGLVHEAMLADFPDLRGVDVYVCGSVKMVEHAVPEFLAHGLGAEACFTDAFHAAAR